jgi:penicillin-binding protein 2
MTSEESYQRLQGRPIGKGDEIQAAIGQSETLLTPLHMATIAMTIANGGVRYRPHLVDSIWNYDATELVHKIEPEIVADMSKGNEEVFKIMQEGMHSLSVRARSQTNMFRYLPYEPAFKTGTPEIITDKLYNSTVLGFYPYENPKIAFAVVLDGGEYSSRAIRNIIDAYFYDHYEPQFDSNGNVRTYWEPWTEPFPQPVPGRYNE